MVSKKKKINVLVHFLLQGLQDRRHFADAHGLEQIFVHPRLNGALGVLKFPVAADDHDMDVGLQGAGGLGKLDAVHAVHADVRDQQVHGVLLQKLQALLAAGRRSGHLKILGELLDDAAHEAQRGHFVVHDQYAVHEGHLLGKTC